MDATGYLIIGGLFVVGLIAGLVVRSRAVWLVPVAVFLGWGAISLAQDGGTGEEGRLGALIVLLLVGVVPTAVGVVVGQVVGQRRSAS